MIIKLFSKEFYNGDRTNNKIQNLFNFKNKNSKFDLKKLNK